MLEEEWTYSLVQLRANSFDFTRPTLRAWCVLAATVRPATAPTMQFGPPADAETAIVYGAAIPQSAAIIAGGHHVYHHVATPPASPSSSVGVAVVSEDPSSVSMFYAPPAAWGYYPASGHLVGHGQPPQHHLAGVPVMANPHQPPSAAMAAGLPGGGHPARPGPPFGRVSGPEGCNLFVFHIPNGMSNFDLYNCFRPFGHVISARIMVDRKSMQPRGFGFVSYDNPSSADLAIKNMNGFRVGWKRLKVRRLSRRRSHPESR